MAHILFLLCFLVWIKTTSSYQVEPLNPTVWKSNVVVHYNTTWQFPFVCNFENVFFDVTTVYLIAHEEKQVTAVTDLYNCCILNADSAECPSSSSVQGGLCGCFRNKRYIAAVATKDQLDYLQRSVSEKDSHYLPGTTWLMNHNHIRKHPDHFTQKLFEFRAFVTNKHVTDSCCYSGLPEKIDRLVSMDYPVNPLTDYESTMQKIVWKSVGKEYEYLKLADIVSDETMQALFSVSTWALLKQQVLWSYCLHSKAWAEQPIAKQIVSACNDPETRINETVRLPFWYAERVSLSPSFQNGFPKPAEVSFATFSPAIDQVLIDENIHLPPVNLATKDLVVAILQRMEGAGFRKILNLDDVSRTLRSELNVHKIEQWYIDGNTSALDQITYFRSFDVLLSTHSSQLTNLMFARNTSHVIEIQPEHGREFVFHKKGQAVGLDYYLLTQGHRFRTHGHEPSNWRGWDYEVNLDQLRLALRLIVRKRREWRGLS